MLRNALDASGHEGCRISTELRVGERKNMWLTFGEVTPGPEAGGEIAASSRCGNGAFDLVSREFSSLVGAPYLIVDLGATPSEQLSGEIDLAASVEIRKLSGRDQAGESRYERSAHGRTFAIDPANPLILPVLDPDEQESESLGVHEILVRLSAEELERPLDAAYGALSVTADAPGLKIFLDGGLVGRTSEGMPAIVNNVLVGERGVRVADLSGREATRQVVVTEGEVAEVHFDLLRLASLSTGDGLVPLGPNPQGYEEFWRNKDGAITVAVPAGEFSMGSPQGKGQPHERPQHRVYVSEFLIDKTEVTWRQFRKYVLDTATQLPPERSWGNQDDYPVSSVTWEQAHGYCEWVGGRLPTEAEWEKAASGPDGLLYPWGNTWEADRCNSWVGGTNSPFEIGTFPACVSPYGVLDMAGSMWEWCSDWYQADYYAASPERDPTGPPSGTRRVQRGGDWIAQPMFLRTAHRYSMPPGTHYQSNGFRCVQEQGP